MDRLLAVLRFGLYGAVLLTVVTIAFARPIIFGIIMFAAVIASFMA